MHVEHAEHRMRRDTVYTYLYTYRTDGRRGYPPCNIMVDFTRLLPGTRARPPPLLTAFPLGVRLRR